MAIDPADVISDHSIVITNHSIVSWRVLFHHQYPIVLEHVYRRWSKLNMDEFRSALLNSESCDNDHRPDSVKEYFNMCRNVLQSLADKSAVVKRITMRRQRLASWMDDDCCVLRRRSRQLERRY